MIGFQASERSGTIECELINEKRVPLRANAVIMNEMNPKWIKNNLLQHTI